MFTFEEAHEVLTQLADSLPPAIYEKLNGGILLLPDTVVDNNNLLILGQYHVEPHGFGRYVTIHYGSVIAAYGYLPPPLLQQKFEDVLRHELTHHLEHLAGDRSLEIQDEINVAAMLRERL